MRVWKPAAVLALTAGVAACTPGGDDGDGEGNNDDRTCVRHRETGGCSCVSFEIEISADFDVVDSCEADSGTGDSCCFDLSSDGTTSECTCGRALCFMDTDTFNCECRFFVDPLVGSAQDNEVEVPSCELDPVSGECCDFGDSCVCVSGTFTTCGGVNVVDRCLPPTTPQCGDRQSSGSCDELSFGG